jgi:uncharacterized protein (UPF0335 family)
MTMWSETIPVSEAAERLLSFIHQIRALDDAYEQMMKDKATVYRTSKKDGFNKAAIKAVVNDPSVDADVKALRRYLDLIVGPEAAAAMKDPDHFGSILFGAEDSWPTTMPIRAMV